jgi:hypothetical protein
MSSFEIVVVVAQGSRVRFLDHHLVRQHRLGVR